MTNPLPPPPPFPEDLHTFRNLLWGGPYFWGYFALKRVLSRTQPDLPAEEDLDPSMDGYIPYDILVERERERSPKNKHVAFDEGDAAADRLELPIDE